MLTCISPPLHRSRIYHIVHADRLQTIVRDGYLWSDAVMAESSGTAGTYIGMNNIKQRRRRLPLQSHPDLHVGECVPFYFCPRSIMLYVIHMANHSELIYRGGQGPIVHLEADLQETVDWAEHHSSRWAFTDRNAGSSYFSDWSDFAHLGNIDWNAVQARDWRNCKEGKQAEFLVERQFPWNLVLRIGVLTAATYAHVARYLQNSSHKPRVEVKRDWYY